MSIFRDCNCRKYYLLEKDSFFSAALNLTHPTDTVCGISNSHLFSGLIIAGGEFRAGDQTETASSNSPSIRALNGTGQLRRSTSSSAAHSGSPGKSAYSVIGLQLL